MIQGILNLGGQSSEPVKNSSLKLYQLFVVFQLFEIISALWVVGIGVNLFVERIQVRRNKVDLRLKPCFENGDIADTILNSLFERCRSVMESPCLFFEGGLNLAQGTAQNSWRLIQGVGNS